MIRRMAMTICYWLSSTLDRDLPFPYPFDRGYEEPEDCWCGAFELGEDD